MTTLRKALQEKRTAAERTRKADVNIERGRLEDEIKEKALSAVTPGAKYVWISLVTEIEFEENRRYLKRKLHMKVEPVMGQEQDTFTNFTYVVKGAFRF